MRNFKVFFSVLFSFLAMFTMTAALNTYAAEVTYNSQANFNGLGDEYRDEIKVIINLINAKNYLTAESKLNDVVNNIKAQMTDKQTKYVCFEFDPQYQEYLKSLAPTNSSTNTDTANGDASTANTSANPEPVTRVSWAFCNALYLKAFLASDRRDWDQALAMLQEQRNYAPYSAQAYFEEGYIYNQQKKPQLAIDAYQKGVDLTKKYAFSKLQVALGLRGIAYAQVELGKLEEAKATLQESLKFEPQNSIAVNELKYIENLQRQKNPPKSSQ